MNVKMQFVAREVAGEYILVPVGKTTLDMNGMMTLNEVGAFLWEHLPTAENEAALVDAVLVEYEAERSEVEKDVSEFLSKLRELKIIDEA